MKKCLVLLGLCSFLAATPVLLRPVIIRTDETSHLAVFPRRRTGEIRFVNSVTGMPVTINFVILDRFRQFSVQTDETTRAYYSHGVYDLDATLADEATTSLKFCSMKGMTLRLGFSTYTIQDGCLEAELLWIM